VKLGTIKIMEKRKTETDIVERKLNPEEKK